MRTLSMTALLLSSALVLAGCGQGTPPAASVPANPQAFFAANGVQTQTKTLTVGSGSVNAQFAGGTALTFAPDAVQLADGSPYSGPVNVSVREVRSRSDMILSNVLPVSDRQALVSGGMFELELKTPGGADLKINPARGVAAAVPAVGQPDQKMQQFVGNRCLVTPRPETGGVGGCDPLPAGESSVNWAPVAGQFGINTATTPGSYVFSVFQKGWINCDFFYSDPRPKGTIHVDFTPVNDLNTVVFLIPQGINTVIALYTTDGPNRRKSYTNSLPVGLQGEIVALTFNGGKEYLAHQTVTISDGLNISLNFNESTDAQIKAYLTTQQ